jgi:hypothetical protein
LSDFEYLGRLITHERPIIRKSNSSHEKFVFPSNTLTSSDEDIDDLNKPIGVIRINDRHFRESILTKILKQSEYLIEF